VLDQIAFTGAGWEHEYFSYRFDTLPHAGLPRAEDHGKPAESREPDAAVLDELFGTNCCGRFPKWARDFLAWWSAPPRP
jgi:hypothetical protein